MDFYLNNFCRLSEARNSVKESRAIFLGVPYDWSTIDRPGSRYGPLHIRKSFEQFLGYDSTSGKDLYESLLPCDLGDIAVVPGDYTETQKRTEETLEKILSENSTAFIIGLGGEHSVTHSFLKTLKKVHKDMLVVSFDAHPDLKEDYMGNKETNVTYLRRACDFIDPSAISLVGIRDADRDEIDYAKKNKISILHTKNIKEDLESSLSSFKKAINGKKVYVTIDIDVLDTAIAPGTSSPSPGGLNMAEMKAFLDICIPQAVGMDVVEVSPPFDTGEITSFTAAKLIYCALSLKA